MDAPNPSAIPTAASRAPLHIGAVGLIARDLDRLTTFYRDLLGLALQAKTNDRARLGVGDVTLLELTHRPDALPDDNREAGLYHTAFLMPTRPDLARWIVQMAKNRVPITGASDHGVSEAIYLDDPEGNGIEVYSDRPRDLWQRNGALILQKTDPLDIEDIVREVDPATATYREAPGGLRVGHIHLRVGDVDKSEDFYVKTIGFEVTRHRTGATFISSAGYHHHIAGNVWHSNRAGLRDDKRAGLDWFEIAVNDRATMDGLRQRLKAAGATLSEIPGGFVVADPWGTRVRFVKA